MPTIRTFIARFMTIITQPQNISLNMFTKPSKAVPAIGAFKCDELESPCEWYFNDEADNPLEEFVINLVFSTYVVARDITAGEGRYDPYNLQILKQWVVVLDRRYGFNTVAGPVVGGARHCDPMQTKFTLTSHSVMPSVVPTKRGFSLNAHALFQADVANNVFTDHDTARNKFSAGKNIKALAAKIGALRQGALTHIAYQPTHSPKSASARACLALFFANAPQKLTSGRATRHNPRWMPEYAL
jgi:hypothetical protein